MNNYAPINGLAQKFRQHVNPKYGLEVALRLLDFKSNPKLGFRTAASEAELAAGDYLYEEMKKIGLKNVHKSPVKVDGWTFKRAQLKHPRFSQAVELSAYPCQFTTDGFEDFDLIYLNKGTKADYQSLDARGKFVLVDINQRDDWWICYPALEAQVQGAIGIIAVQSERFAEISPDALNSNDSNGPKTSVTLSISQTHADILKEEIKNSPNHSIKIQLDVDSQIQEKSTTYNIIGQIPGQTSEELIILSGHYDAYFDGFQDNASAVGLIFAVAKAMVEMELKPRRTIVFMATAAEEWGLVDSRYDWSSGAFQELYHSGSNWRNKAILNLNFELTAYRHNRVDYINCVPELVGFLNETINHLPNNADIYPEGIKAYSPLSTWADDWSFSTSGIPALRNDFTRSSFNDLYYHSQFDNPDTYDEASFNQHIQNYGSIAIYASELDYIPLDLIQSLSDYQDFIKNSGYMTSKLENILDQCHASYKNLLNSPKVSNQKLKTCYSFYQDHFTSLNWDEEQVYKTHHYIKRVNLLEEALAELCSNQPDLGKALDTICQIDTNHYARYFSPEVYLHFLQQTTQEEDLQSWGAKKVTNHLDLSNLVHQISHARGLEALSEWKVTLKAAISYTKKTLEAKLEKDLESFRQLNKLINSLID